MGGKNATGRGGRTARMPATRFPQLQKRLRQGRIPRQGKSSKYTKKLP